MRQDKFEEIERQQFGKDGYEDAVAQIGQIEQALGLVDLAQSPRRRRPRHELASKRTTY